MREMLVCLLMLLGASACQAQPSPFGRIEQYTGRLELPDGSVCSGTRFHTAILTSRHCLEGPSRQVRFQGILVNVKRVWIDGENIWVYTDREWGAGPRIAARHPGKGDSLYLIGNAAGFYQIARPATLAGYIGQGEGKMSGNLLVSGNLWHGDSGAGIFNARGEIVGVMLGCYNFGVRESSGVPSLFALGIAVPVRK